MTRSRPARHGGIQCNDRMRHDDTAIGGPDGRFPTTRPSLVEVDPSTRSPLPLDRVAALYWKPVYRFVRLKFGKDNEDAKDLTQAFFTGAISRGFLEKFDPTRGSFRTYLRTAVERFAANEYASASRQKRGGGFRIEPLEDHDVAGESPEDAFEREWRRQILTLAIGDLRERAHASGKQLAFAVFEEYDLAEGERPSYAELAEQHRIPETTVTNYLAWARRTLRALAIERVRGVTAGDGELAEEMRRLWT